jgi:hypothetical protein
VTNDTPWGENLAAGYNDTQALCTAWGVDERPMYSYSAAQYVAAAGHFTQMVWKDTQRIGCAAVDCGPGGLAGAENLGDGNGVQYVVCHYSRRGNTHGQFLENVLPP